MTSLEKIIQTEEDSNIINQAIGLKTFLQSDPKKISHKTNHEPPLMLSQIVEENKSILMAGVFNIELLQQNNAKADFLYILYSFPSVFTNNF